MAVQRLEDQSNRLDSSTIQQRSQVHSGGDGLFHQLGRSDPAEDGDIRKHD
jgi:hypothetical protein